MFDGVARERLEQTCRQQHKRNKQTDRLEYKCNVTSGTYRHEDIGREENGKR